MCPCAHHEGLVASRCIAPHVFSLGNRGESTRGQLHVSTALHTLNETPLPLLPQSTYRVENWMGPRTSSDVAVNITISCS